LVDDLILRAEESDDRVVPIGLDGFDEGDHIRLEPEKAVDQDGAPGLPVATHPPEILCKDAYQSGASLTRTSRSGRGGEATARNFPGSGSRTRSS
jgi:hypothetical protein